MEFEEAVEIVRSVEAKALEYSAPEGEGEPAKRRIEFSPPEFSEMGYEEALTLNGRVEKVIAGSEMLMRMYGGEAPAAPQPAAAPAEEKVSAVMEAMVPQKEEVEEEAAPPAPRPPEPEIEMEAAGVADTEIEFEERRAEAGAPEFEREVAGVEKRPSAAAVPEIRMRVPPILASSPSESATETIERIEKQFGSEVKAGKKVDKDEVKKRMLELTRELFREKSTARREEIKKEIVALKTILSGAGKKAAGAKPKADIMEVVRNDQEFELASAKKAVNEAYETAFAPLARYFEEEAALGKAGEALPAFISRAEQLKEQVGNLASSYEKYLVGKHSSEFEQLEKKGRMGGAGRVAEKSADTYAAEFFSLRQAIWSDIDSEVEKRKAEAKGGLAGVEEETEEDLLALLQAEEPLEYEKYSRGEMERGEALAEARRLKARKGINTVGE